MRLLGRHIGRGSHKCSGNCAHGRSLARGCRRLDELCESKIQQFCPAFYGDDDIGRFQIAVNDTGRVGGRERIRDVGGIFYRVFHWQPAAGVHLLERSAGNVLHRDETNTVLFHDVVDRDNVGVIESGGGPCFLQESALPAGIGDLLRGQGFQGDDTVKTNVTSLIDLAHSSSPQ